MTDILRSVDEAVCVQVQDEMLAVAWKMEEDGNVNIELYIQACLAKDEFGSLLKDKIMSIFSGM